MDMHSEKTLLSSFAMVYLALAHGTDAELHDDELAAMTEALSRWAPSRSEAEIQELIMETGALYLHGDRETEIKSAMLNIRREASVVDRIQAIQDLIDIANADGVVLETEEGLIHALRSIWALKDL